MSGADSVSFCLPCPAGTYCDKEGWANFSFPLCKGGYYCPSPYFQLSLEESFLTSRYDADFYDLSYENILTTIMTGQSQESLDEFLCPLGHWCPPGSSLPEGCCVNGSTTSMQYCNIFQPENGSLVCEPCPAGMVCIRVNLADETAFSVTTAECPQFFFCPLGSLPLSCPDGFYGSTTGLKRSTDCSPCPSGMWCAGGEIKGSCAAGFICSRMSHSATPVI